MWLQHFKLAGKLASIISYGYRFPISNEILKNVLVLDIVELGQQILQKVETLIFAKKFNNTFKN